MKYLFIYLRRTLDNSAHASTEILSAGADGIGWIRIDVARDEDGSIVDLKDGLAFYDRVSGDYLEKHSYRLSSRIFLSVYCDHFGLITTTLKDSQSIKVLFIALKSTGLHLHLLKLTYADYTSRAFANSYFKPDVLQLLLSRTDFCS